MIRKIEFRGLMSKVEMVPQAILAYPVDKFVQRLGAFVKDHDALDWFEGAAFVLNNHYQFALIHHRGDQKNTTTVYLPDNVSDAQEIVRIVKDIVDDLDLPQKAIHWQRADGVKV